MYKYANKHFNQHERNDIWREINTVSDVEIKFNYCDSQINLIKEMHPKNRIREDFIEAEKSLGNIEIALSRIETFPNYFNLNNKERLDLKSKFNSFEQEIVNLNMQRVSWD